MLGEASAHKTWAPRRQLHPHCSLGMSLQSHPCGLGNQVPSPRPLELFHIPRRVSAGWGSAFRHRAGLRAAGFGPGPVLSHPLILGDGSGLDAARQRGRRSHRHAGELAGAFSSIWWLNIYEVGEQTKHRESKETEPDTCSC